MEDERGELQGYFTRYGWQFERRTDELFRTGFVGDTGHYEVWLRTTENWVFFTINPYLKKPKASDFEADVFEHMLRLNHEVNLAKFLVDDDGDIALSVELPRDGFQYSHFADALTALSHYADEHRVTFEALMHDADSSGEVV